MPTYPGGKASAGTYQRIINQIPPHRFYCEPFAGSAAIARHKRPADKTILLDLDPGAIAMLGDRVPLGSQVLEADGISWLENNVVRIGSDWFLYIDPPYLPESCLSRPRYRCNLDLPGHRRLLSVIQHLACPVMISGYWSELYARKLKSWRVVRFWQQTRGGFPCEEWLWMNYPEPTELHDYRYLGANYREREKFTRQQKRWRARLARMDRLQRFALLSALRDLDPGATAIVAEARASRARKDDAP